MSHTAWLKYLSFCLYHRIHLVSLQHHKESPVTSHRPAVTVSSCPLLRLHTISRSLTAGVKAPKTDSVFTLQLS